MADGQQGRVGLVLAGGGARGAYEIGALSALLPALERRGERPRVIVGTSVGALNAAYLAASAERPADDACAEGERIWLEIGYRDVLAPLLTPRSAWRGLRLARQLAGLGDARLPSLVDPAPLEGTLRRLIPFERLRANVEQGHLDAAAVVATSAATSRTVVFHDGGGSPEPDDKRGIDYVATTLAVDHVRASAAIPALFPAIRIAGAEAGGWHWDGGTRLNTPIKPALALGAERVIVLALNSITPAAAPAAPPERAPDFVEGMAQFLQAVLVDPLVQDVRTLAGINARIAADEPDSTGRQAIPYIFIAPAGRDAIGAIAMRVFNEHYGGLRAALRHRDLALLGRMVAGGSDPLHGELLSYLFFSPELARELLDLGRRDAERWLAATHDDGPWELGPLP